MTFSLQQVEAGTSVADVRRKMGTIHRSKKRFGSQDLSRRFASRANLKRRTISYGTWPPICQWTWRGLERSSEGRSPAQAPNVCWPIEWVYGELFDGRRIWVLTIDDNFSRVSLGLWVARDATAMDVVKVLDNAFREASIVESARNVSADSFVFKLVQISGGRPGAQTPLGW